MALTKQLELLRDTDPIEPIGMRLGDYGDWLPVCFQADHGGPSMKFILVVLAREKDGQAIKIDLARFEGKDTHRILQNTVMPHLNQAFETLRSLVLVVLQWEGGYDIVEMPKEKKGTMWLVRLDDEKRTMQVM
jgi:hypothetical protein